jgi:hypothetical protein
VETAVRNVHQIEAGNGLMLGYPVLSCREVGDETGGRAMMSMVRAGLMAIAVSALLGTALPSSAQAESAWCLHHPRDARCHHHPPPRHHVLPWCDRYHHTHCRHR